MIILSWLFQNTIDKDGTLCEDYYLGLGLLRRSKEIFTSAAATPSRVGGAGSTLFSASRPDSTDFAGTSSLTSSAVWGVGVVDVKPAREFFLLFFFWVPRPIAEEKMGKLDVKKVASSNSYSNNVQQHTNSHSPKEY